MDSLQLAGGLKTTQRRDNRIEHGKQDQHPVLIRMHTSIASLIPIATDAVQLLQQSAQVIDVLQSENDFALDSIFAVLCHASIAEKRQASAKAHSF